MRSLPFLSNFINQPCVQSQFDVATVHALTRSTRGSCMATETVVPAVDMIIILSSDSLILLVDSLAMTVSRLIHISCLYIKIMDHGQ